LDDLIAAFYVWDSVPRSIENSRDWCLKVLDEISIWMIPGSMYGKYRELFFRIALTHPVERLREAVERLRKFLT
jgi:LL-diaminopimelate aminotransferase